MFKKIVVLTTIVMIVTTACSAAGLPPIGATPTVAPAAPTTAPEPTKAPELTAVPPTATPKCKVINDYQLLDLPEVSVESKGWLHIETFINGKPEYETVLPSGRYTIDQSKTNGGHVWEYSPNCTVDQVLAQVAIHIARRLELKANNKGYIHYQKYIDSGLFTVVAITGNPDIPLALP